MNKFFAIILLCVSSLIVPIGVHAQIPTGIVTVPFGGTVLSTIPCLCSSSLLVTIEDFRTKLPIGVLYIPFVSRLNRNFNIFIPGNSALGQYYTSPLQCRNGIIPFLPIEPFCVNTGIANGIITSLPFAGTGSSLLPSFPKK